MWRDPLDEVIADLERIVPPTPAKRTGIPWDFWEEAERIDREFALEQAQQHPRTEKPPSTISMAPAVWPVRPARRRDPSVPIWDDAADTPDTDPDDSSG